MSIKDIEWNTSNPYADLDPNMLPIDPDFMVDYFYELASILTEINVWQQYADWANATRAAAVAAMTPEERNDPQYSDLIETPDKTADDMRRRYCGVALGLKIMHARAKEIVQIAKLRRSLDHKPGQHLN